MSVVSNRDSKCSKGRTSVTLVALQHTVWQWLASSVISGSSLTWREGDNTVKINTDKRNFPLFFLWRCAVLFIHIYFRWVLKRAASIEPVSLFLFFFDIVPSSETCSVWSRGKHHKTFHVQKVKHITQKCFDLDQALKTTGKKTKMHSKKLFFAGLYYYFYEAIAGLPA